MSDAFTALAALVALGTPLVAGPVGVVDADPVIALHGTAEAGASRSIEIAYRDGETAGRLGVDRATVRFEDLPEDFVQALVAVEDASFERHMGLDPAGIGRAVVGALGGRSDAGGGSSLTQQLAKNALVGDSATLERKVAEAIAAVMTESVATKEEILESYANAVYFGRRSDGAANAAQNWFGRDWDALALSENAFLAGVLRAPSGLDPLRNEERARARRDHVLDRMAEVGFITPQQRDAAQAEPIAVAPPPPPPQAGPSPSDPDYWALSEARRFIGIGPYLDQPEGRPFVTTLDAEAQAIAQRALDAVLEPVNRRLPDAPLGRLPERALDRAASNPDSLWLAADRVVARLPEGVVRVIVGRDGLIIEPRETVDTTGATQADAPAAPTPQVPRGAELGDVFALFPDGEVRGRPRVQGALVAIDLNTNEPIASVGGTRSWASGFDRTRAQRQPGSSFKPFVWLAALDGGVRPQDWVLNGPIAVTIGTEVWSPGNYDGGGGSYVPVFTALERSYNQVAARLAMHVGMEEVRRVAVSASLYPPDERGLLFPSASIGAVETSPYRMALAMANLDPRRSDISSRENLEALESMMRGVVVRGTAAGAFANGPSGVIGKTGTSQEHRDNWFVGRTGDIAFAVWIGRDDDDPLPSINGRRATGGSFAAPIAASFIRDARAAGIISEEIETSLFAREEAPYWIEPEQPQPEPQPDPRGGGWWAGGGGGWNGQRSDPYAGAAPADAWRPGWAQ
ncbi:transglycosylase domain-containing protein [Salinarimonas ramus]|uniref:peptidoglycan glycosyltransferase n=1 Tax=Salinarimonas ramus TaxID=690164 RepID=A0A917Q847_9HYPH|nr:transglycosylase domain-containing protein [Salinarimonas ramus]GGK34723.1 penicillin-binding protein 1A [Salinarimonas ramus]